jgi:hypothetical protein
MKHDFGHFRSLRLQPLSEFCPRVRIYVCLAKVLVLTTAIIVYIDAHISGKEIDNVLAATK